MEKLLISSPEATLPETNRSPLKINGWKIKCPFGISLFSSFREGMTSSAPISWKRWRRIWHWRMPVEGQCCMQQPWWVSWTHRMAGRHWGNCEKVKFQSGKVFASGRWWVWRCFEMTRFIWGACILFFYVLLMMCDDEGGFLGWATGILFWFFSYMVHMVLCDSGKFVSLWVGQHDEVTTSRCDWRCRYQAFEICHFWSFRFIHLILHLAFA